MPSKLQTTILNIDIKIRNQTKKQFIKQFHEYLQSIDTSENYQNELLKVIIRYGEYLQSLTFYDNNTQNQILQFLDMKRKTNDVDPDTKWITTWNDFLWRIKNFFRWLYNRRKNESLALSKDNWVTPQFVNIKIKKPSDYVPT